MFLEPAESALNRTKKSLQKKEYGEISILLDIWETIHKYSILNTLEVIALFYKKMQFGNIGPKGNEIIAYRSSLETSVITFLSTLINEFNVNSFRLIVV